jgi:hypothetical protein
MQVAPDVLEDTIPEVQQVLHVGIALIPLPSPYFAFAR